MFSPNHRQHLLVAFKHLDEALDEVLQRLGAPAGVPLFERSRDDVDPAARDRAASAIDDVRGEMRRFMARHGLEPKRADLGATHIARSRLDLAMVAASELGPRHLRGYGELDDAEMHELTSFATTLGDQLAAVIKLLPEPRQ